MLNKPIKVKSLTKIYNGKKQNKKIVFENLNITFESGKIHCLLGKSGCGKSTLLKMLAGLENFNKGDINIGNLKENHLSMILQDNNLLPWLNTYQNIEFAVKANKLNKNEKYTLLDDTFTDKSIEKSSEIKEKSNDEEEINDKIFELFDSEVVEIK